MFIVDDPLLALILRFVVDSDQPDAANEEFLKRQIKMLRQYVAQFPEHQQGEKAMEWIERHAQHYRRNWQQRTVSQRTVYLRCSDCPLAERGAAEHCEIHEQWLYLLRQYTAGKVASKGYIEECLRLLREHKTQLALRGASRKETREALQLPESEKKKKKKKKKKRKQKKLKAGAEAAEAGPSSPGALGTRRKTR